MGKKPTMGGCDSWYDSGEQGNTENMMRVTFEHHATHNKRLFVRLLNGAAYVSTIHGCIPQQSAPMLSGDCLRRVYQAGALMHRQTKED
jgi:hypothetical protein